MATVVSEQRGSIAIDSWPESGYVPSKLESTDVRSIARRLLEKTSSKNETTGVRKLDGIFRIAYTSSL
jgi:hypothetical protein